jgi:hypothetical protein
MHDERGNDIRWVESPAIDEKLRSRIRYPPNRYFGGGIIRKLIIPDSVDLVVELRFK